MQLLAGHDLRVNDIAFSPDGRLLASCGNDRTVRVWDTVTGEGDVLARDELHTAVAFAPDGGHVLARCRWGGLHLWSVTERRCVARPLAPAGRPYRGGLAVSATAGLVAADEQEPDQAGRVVWVWEAATWERWAFRPTRDGRPHAGLAFDPTGTRLATTGGVFDALTGAPAVDAALVGDSLAWSPTAEVIADAGHERKVVVWDAGTGECVALLSAGGRRAKCVAFSPDGRHVVAVSVEGVARVWETAGWSEGPGFGWDVGPLGCVAFAPDGLRAACAGRRGVIVVWDWDP